MPTSDLYPLGEPSIPIPSVLLAARDRLRLATFNREYLLVTAVPQIDRFARNLKSSHSDSDRLYFLWSKCLLSEIFDYYGEYENARIAIDEEGRRLERALGSQELSVERTPLFRQELWTLVFHAHNFYRDENLEHSGRLLAKIREELDRVLPLSAGREPSYGLRARIAYSLGQVKRLSSNVTARREFLRAVELTRKRLSDKTEKYRAAKRPAEDLEREQRYANYVIAKAFAFGLSWASSQAGELDRARGAAAAGCALLQATKDDLHRAYAQVMYAKILRAAARPARAGHPIPPDLREAIEILEPLADPEKSPLRFVKRFLARARYEQVRAFHSAGKYQEAEALVRTIQSQEPHGGRWHIVAGIELTRILVATNRIEEAKVESDSILEFTSPRRKRVAPSLRAEALICRADVLFAQSNSSVQEAHEALDEAQALSEGNPVSVVTCHLYRARCFSRQGNLDEARREMSFWDAQANSMEHGFVIQLAERIAEEIANRDTMFHASREQLFAEKYDGLEGKLQIWAIRTLYSAYGRDYRSHAKEFLGITEGGVRNWEKKHGFDPARMTEESST